MTHDKAREFFSAYHEGTLEQGLTSSLERKFASDAPLRAEYEAFVETIGALDMLRSETITVPSYLNDRIASRIDAARDVAPVPFWSQWLKPRASSSQAMPRYTWAVGLAACLLVATISLKGLKADNTTNASFTPDDSVESVKWTQEDKGLLAKFPAGEARKVSVAPQSADAQTYDLKSHQGLELTLANPNLQARRFTISSGNEVMAVVAIPGTRSIARKSGSGSISEFVSALADTYRVSVIVKGNVSPSTVRWTFDSTDVRAAAEQGLGGQGNAILMNGNVLQIVH